MDGSGETGRVRIDSSAGAPNVLTVSGTELTDAFVGEIDIRANGRLNMNLANDWTVGENGRVDLRGTTGNRALIEGSDLNFRGDLGVNDGSIESNVTFFDTAQVEFIGDSVLMLEGDTLTTIEPGTTFTDQCQRYRRGRRHNRWRRVPGRLDQFRSNLAGVEVASLVNADVGTLVFNIAGDGGVPGLDFDQLIVAGVGERCRWHP